MKCSIDKELPFEIKTYEDARRLLLFLESVFHLFPEIDKSSLRYEFMFQNGKIISTQSVADLKKVKKSAFVFDLDRTDGIENTIKEEHEVMKNNMVKIFLDREKVPGVLAKLLKDDYKVYEVRMVQLSLEDAFLEKTGGNVID